MEQQRGANESWKNYGYMILTGVLTDDHKIDAMWLRHKFLCNVLVDGRHSRHIMG